MKNDLLIILFLALWLPSFGQTIDDSKRIVTQEEIAAGICYYSPNHLREGRPNKKAFTKLGTPRQAEASKTTAVTALGSASNVFTILNAEQNQVFASDTLTTVGFIHRNNAGLFGGNSGSQRFDLSIDGGGTFCTDVGILNPMSSTIARYPNAAIYNPIGNVYPSSATVIGSAPTVGASLWDGQVDFAVSFDCNSPTILDEQVGQSYLGQRNSGGFCEGLHGEFWSTFVERTSGDSAIIHVFKRSAGGYPMSIQSSGNIVLSLSTARTPVLSTNIAFSPDGSVGYIATLTDLAGGQDSVLHPVFMKTTDNGATWSSPAGVDFSNFPWIRDTLQTLWETSPGVPASFGIATTGFDFDLTVDFFGNPHLAVVIGSLPWRNEYTIASSLAKFLGDVHSTDGGQTWAVMNVSPILTFRTPDFGTSTTVYMDNFPQISRTEDGRFVFYSWADSDTSQFTGNQNGIGFGEEANLEPNLRIAGLSVVDGERTYPQLITDGNLTWEGRILFPTMAPTVLRSTSYCFDLPIVTAEMPALDPLSETFFHYLGKEAQLCLNDFCPDFAMELYWPVFGYTNAQPPCLVTVVEDHKVRSIRLEEAYPNPNCGQVVLGFDLPFENKVLLELTNAYGQKVRTLAKGTFARGSHRIEVNTEDLASGIYFYSLRTENESISKSMVIAK